MAEQLYRYCFEDGKMHTIFGPDGFRIVCETKADAERAVEQLNGLQATIDALRASR